MSLGRFIVQGVDRTGLLVTISPFERQYVTGMALLSQDILLWSDCKTAVTEYERKIAAAASWDCRQAAWADLVFVAGRLHPVVGVTSS